MRRPARATLVTMSPRVQANPHLGSAAFSAPAKWRHPAPNPLLHHVQDLCQSRSARLSKLPALSGRALESRRFLTNNLTKKRKVNSQVTGSYSGPNNVVAAS